MLSQRIAAVFFIAILAFGRCGAAEPAGPRPNFLWITCEDASEVFGYCGDRAATTPNLDRLAAQGFHYTHAFSVGCVCTPARSTLITGLYASSLGSQHLRSPITLPPDVRCFTHYLRETGYYCANNVKQDYNFDAPAGSWDDSSRQAHWRGRRPGQPFFGVVNLEQTHQGKIRAPEKAFAQLTERLAAAERHDPAKVPLPPYYPDTPAIRRDVARFYDLVTAMDKQAGDLLAELRADGLAEDTIVFFFPDHGTGMPRHKRAVYDSGTRVPLVVYLPPKFARFAPGRPGAKVDRLVCFADFGPTVLSLAGVRIPAAMQGRAMLGPQQAPPREFVVSLRDRVDECFELSRAVRDRRYRYVRNFMPHRAYMQWSAFSEPTPTVFELRRLAAAGKLDAAQSLYLQPTKPAEELYDLDADPWEVRNLAGDPQHRPTLDRLRDVLRQWMIETRDTALLPEAELFRRAAGRPPRTALGDDAAFSVRRILAAADLVGRVPAKQAELVALLDDADSAVRYWAAVGLACPGADARAAAAALRRRLDDAAPDVRLAAAEALCRAGRTADAAATLAAGLKDADPRVRLHAAAILVALQSAARPLLANAQAALAQPAPPADEPYGLYVRWALERFCLNLTQPEQALQLQPEPKM